jgi:hypothetical protein
MAHGPGYLRRAAAVALVTLGVALSACGTATTPPPQGSGGDMVTSETAPVSSEHKHLR